VIVNTINELDRGLTDAEELLLMAIDENDEETVDTVVDDLNHFEKRVADLEFRRMFSGEMDAIMPFWIYSPVQAAPKRKIGHP